MTLFGSPLMLKAFALLKECSKILGLLPRNELYNFSFRNFRCMSMHHFCSIFPYKLTMKKLIFLINTRLVFRISVPIDTVIIFPICKCGASNNVSSNIQCVFKGERTLWVEVVADFQRRNEVLIKHQGLMILFTKSSPCFLYWRLGIID